MKRLLQFKSIGIIVLAFLSQAGKAQFNGTYSIGDSAEFTTIQSAIDSVTLVGVSGPVTFEIDSGVYYEYPVFSEIPGASETNTITFKSKDDSASYVTIQETMPSVVNFIGADYVTLKSVTIDGYFSCVHFQGGSDHITLDNCIVKGANVATNNRSFDAITGSVDYDNNYITIKNCTVYDGSIGIYLPAKTTEKGHVIEDNRIYGSYVHSIDLLRADSAVIRNNIITSTTNNIQKNACGILVNASGNTVVEGNYINVHKHGIRVHNYAVASDTNYVINNEVICKYNGSAFYAYSLYITGGNKNLFIYNNSFYKLFHGSYGAVQSTNSSNDENIRIVNNVFSSLSYTTSAIFYSQSSAYYIAHNNFDDAAGSGQIYINNSWYKVSEISGSLIGESNYSYNPGFISDDDLHITNGLMGNLGTPLENVTVDINDTPRDASAPDIGAHEFTPFDTLDLAVLNSPDSKSAMCSMPESFDLLLKNIGGQEVTSFVIERSLNGEIVDSVNIEQTLASYDTATINVPFNPLTDGDSVSVKIVMINNTTDPTPDNNVYEVMGLWLALTEDINVSTTSELDSAINELRLRGICNSIEIILEPGVYNSRINFEEIVGVDENTKLTIRSSTGNREDVVLAPDNSTNYAVRVSGTDYVTLKDFSIVVDTVNSYGVYHYDGNYLTLDNLYVIGDINRNKDVIYSYCENDHNLTVTNCKINNGDVAISISGDSPVGNIVVRDNILLNQSSAGIYADYINDITIDGNTITNDSTYSSYGMEIYDVYGKLIMTNNQVYIDSTSSAGADIEYFYGSGANRSYIANNVFNIGGRPWAGVYLYEVTNTMFSNNTVVISSTANNDYALYVDYLSVMDIRNNIIEAKSDATALYMYVPSGVTYMDYNNIHVEDGYIMDFDGQKISSFEDWQQLGWDQHSMSVDPMLYNNATPCNTALYNVGVFAEDLLKTDLFGKKRNVSTPDIGAVETGVSLGEDFTLCNTPVLLDAGAGAITYSWSTGENTQTVEISEPGTYIVDVEGVCNTTLSDTIEIIGNELEASFEFEVLENNIVALYSKSTGNISGYSWDFEAGTSSQENALAFFNSEGSYTVSLEVSNSCTSDVIEQTIDIFYTGINDLTTEKIAHIFPNPVENTLNIKFTNEEAHEVQLRLVNASGKLCRQFTIQAGEGNNYFAEDVSALPTGMYLLVINDKNTYKIYKK